MRSAPVFVLVSLVVPVLHAQSPLAVGGARWTGGTTQVGWYEIGGQVWRTDGSDVGTWDTGIAAGLYAVTPGGLIVYYPRRVARVRPDGSSSQHPVPFSYQGAVTTATDPTVWRYVPSLGVAVELAELVAGSWQMSRREFLLDPRDSGAEIEGTWESRGKCYVWFESSSETWAAEVLSGWEWPITDTGYHHGIGLFGTWSRGKWFTGESGQRAADRIIWMQGYVTPPPRQCH